MNNKELLIELYSHPLVQRMLIKELLTKRQLVELVLLEKKKWYHGPWYKEKEETTLDRRDKADRNTSKIASTVKSKIDSWTKPLGGKADELIDPEKKISKKTYDGAFKKTKREIAAKLDEKSKSKQKVYSKTGTDATGSKYTKEGGIYYTKQDKSKGSDLANIFKDLSSSLGKPKFQGNTINRPTVTFLLWFKKVSELDWNNFKTETEASVIQESKNPKKFLERTQKNLEQIALEIGLKIVKQAMDDLINDKDLSEEVREYAEKNIPKYMKARKDASNNWTDPNHQFRSLLLALGESSQDFYEKYLKLNDTRWLDKLEKEERAAIKRFIKLYKAEFLAKKWQNTQEINEQDEGENDGLQTFLGLEVFAKELSKSQATEIWNKLDDAEKQIIVNLVKEYPEGFNKYLYGRADTHGDIWGLEDEMSNRLIRASEEEIEKTRGSLKKILPFAINKSARLIKALEKMVSFLDKDTLKDPGGPELGKREFVSEDMNPPMKSRQQIKDQLEKELKYQKELMKLLEFYFKVFVQEKDKLQDANFLDQMILKAKNIVRMMKEILADASDSIKTKFVGGDEEGTQEQAEEVLETEPEQAVNEQQSGTSAIDNANEWIQAIESLIRDNYTRLERVYGETKKVLSDLKKGQFELSSELQDILNRTLGSKVIDLFDKALSDLKNNLPMEDYKTKLKNISDLENRDLVGLKPDVEPVTEAPEDQETQPANKEQAQREFIRTYDTFESHKNVTLKALEGLRRSLDSVDQEKYFAFFQLAGKTAEKITEYDNSLNEIKKFLANPTNVPDYIKIGEKVRKKEELIPKQGKQLIPAKYAEQIKNSIGQQDELKRLYDDQQGQGGLSMEKVEEYMSDVSLVIDVLSAASAATGVGLPAAAALQALGKALTVGEIAKKLADGDFAGAGTKAVLMLMPGEKIAKYLGGAAGKVAANSFGKFLKPLSDFMIKNPDKAGGVIDLLITGVGQKLDNDDTPEETTGTPAGKIEKAKTELEELKEAIGKTNAADDQKKKWIAFINDAVNRTVAMGEEDLTDEQYLKILLDAKQTITNQIKQFQNNQGNEPKQEHIERALKPIIEQLLRGKHGEKELYY